MCANKRTCKLASLLKMKAEVRVLIEYSVFCTINRLPVIYYKILSHDLITYAQTENVWRFAFGVFFLMTIGWL